VTNPSSGSTAIGIRIVLSEGYHVSASV